MIKTTLPKPPPKPKPASDFAQWIAANPPPDLQALVRKAGERRAAELGVPFEPGNPDHAGYWHITEEEWRAYLDDMKRWQGERRDRFLRT